MLRPQSCALLLGLAMLCAGPVALAASGAAASFDRGLSLYESGDYDGAAREFFAAYKKDPHPFSLYNAGLAWELAGAKPTAATAYELALSKGLEKNATQDASTRLEKLSGELGRVELTAPEGATVHVEPFELRDDPAIFYVQPGRHRIRITLADDTPLSRPVEVEAGETAVLEVSASGETTSATERDGKRKRPANDEGDAIDLQTLGFVSIGVAAVAATAAIVLGLQAVSAKEEYDNSGHTDRVSRDRAENLMHWTNIAWATAAITGVAGGVLIFTASSSDSGTSGGVWLRGNF